MLREQLYFYIYAAVHGVAKSQPRICSNACPLSQWCYLTISSSAHLFSFCLHSFPSLTMYSTCKRDFPGGSDGKSVCLQCRRPGFDHCVGKILWRRKWQPTSTLTWKIPWMEESGKLQSVGLQRVGQDWVTSPYLTLPYWIVFYHTVVEKAMAPHSSTLAWKIPWTEEPGRLQSMVLLRVGHDFTFTFHFDALEKKW